MANDPNPQDYASVARRALDKLKSKTVARLSRIAAKPVSKKAIHLGFALDWNAYHELQVYCAPLGDNGQYTSNSSPFGPILTFDPPTGQHANPRAFATEKPAVARMVLEELAEWWKSVGADYPLPVVGTFDGEPLLALDFATRQWRANDGADRRQELGLEFSALVRARYQGLRPDVVERFRKAVAKLGSGEWKLAVTAFFDDDFEVMFAVTDGTKSAGGRAFPPPGALARRFKTSTYYEDRQRYGELGVDLEAFRRSALEEVIADAWADAIGSKRDTVARLEYHDDGAEYDLVARRWVTDFLGRPLTEPRSSESS